MAKKQGFPKTIFVWKEQESDGSSYLLCSEEIENAVDIGKKTIVGIYSLVESKEAKGIVTVS